MRLLTFLGFCLVALQTSAANAGCTLEAALEYGRSYNALSQDWSRTDRDVWYNTSQGSRLIPLSWYSALRLANEEAMFSDRANQQRYASLLCAESNFPVGFVIDEDPELGAALGLTCAACHTKVLSNGDDAFLVDGANSDLDLQSYMRDLFAGVNAVFADGGIVPGPTWTDFASSVLGAAHTDRDAADLHAELRNWLQKRYQIQASIEAGGIWGHGRTDAVQVILNTAAVISGTRAGVELPISDAPVDFPHIWNAPQMQRVQWNGSATRVGDIGLFEAVEMGAVIRNVAEVIGVFADIRLTSDIISETSSYPNIKSSVRLANLVRLERSLSHLKSPLWPDAWGPVDTAGDMFLQGEELYETYCLACHSRLDRDDLSVIISDAELGEIAHGPVTRHFPAFDMENPGAPALNTDPMMTCNAQTHTSWSGQFRAMHHSFGAMKRVLGGGGLGGAYLDKFPEGTVTLALIEELALRLIVEKSPELYDLQKQDLSHAAYGFFDAIVTGIFGVDPGRVVDPAAIGDVPIQGTHGSQTIEEAREICVTTLRRLAEDSGVEMVVPVYKARPLNGIWASAPYLHNGSVPTLDDLMKAADARPDSFAVGAVTFDTEKVGLGAAQDSGPLGIFLVRDETGRIIPGNSNGGHEYPLGGLNAPERAALIAFLKTF